MRAYCYFIKIRILESLAYQYEFFFTVGKQFLFILLTALFWKALYRSNPTAGGVSVNDMLIYSVISVFLQNFYVKGVEGNLRRRIRDGNIAVDYLKPVNLFAMFFAQDVGSIAVNLLQRFLPALLFACLFVVVPQPASWVALGLFVVSAVMGFVILWCIAGLFGLLYFWLTDTGNLGGIKDYIVGILSGAVIPIWFFPPAAQTVLTYLPFTYTYQLPISIFIGKLTPQQALPAMGIQLVWCGVFFALFAAVSKRATRNILVQGG